MEVNLNSNLTPVPRPNGPQSTAKRAPEASDDTHFVQAEALDKALSNTPEVRPEVVARAKQLIADVNYPPTETMHKLANLLAIHLS